MNHNSQFTSQIGFYKNHNLQHSVMPLRKKTRSGQKSEDELKHELLVSNTG
jgi:hypothetical protein